MKPSPLGFILACTLAVLGPGMAASAAAPSETAVRAAFLSKFVAYVSWPAGFRLAPNDPLALCVVGADPFGQTIDQIAVGQQVDGHPLTVRRLAGAPQAEQCQLAFVQGTAAHTTSELLAAMQGKPILTVTDAHAGPQRGIIHFVMADGRVRFIIDQAAAQQAGLELSSRLLAVALSVKPAR